MKQIIPFLILINLVGCTKYGCIDGDCTNGYGTYLYSNGGTDKGNWVNGKMNGYGVQVQGKGEFEGDIYEGYFKKGEYDGKGTYYFSKIDANLIGEFSNGKPNGQCKVIFGSDSPWEGTYIGTWKDGYNKGFEDHLKTTKDGEKYIFQSGEFFDTINYYYNYANIQRIIDEVRIINHRDLTQENISPKEIADLVVSMRSTLYDITYSIEMIKSFMEYDNSIPYKKAMIDYLHFYKFSIENEFSNWILFIQHKPHKNKPEMIYSALQPFVDNLQVQNLIWEKIRDDFISKYNIVVTTN